MRELRAPQRRMSVSRVAVPALLLAATAVTLTGCGGAPAKATAERDGKAGKADRSGERTAARPGDHKPDPTRIPGVGDALQRRIPEKSRQVVAVHGEHRDSADSTLQVFTRKGEGEEWKGERVWPAHNGRKGWTPDHREDDKRSPVGVFTLTDAGGVRSAPDAKLPYTESSAFTPPSYWPKKTRNDFDHVIAVDYNRVKGTSPLDPTRPQGQEKGGGIWLHLDHGDGTSGCVSVSRAGMRYLLRTLDPAKHPVVVMGDKATLARG